MSSAENSINLLQQGSKQVIKKVINEDAMKKREVIEFDWKNKWLKGDEYAYILNNIDQYCEAFNMSKLSHKTHPQSIYTEPENGMIYFVEGNSVGSDFGFPRVDMKKRYRWKKMNFTTDLPKKRPYVTYIVASAVKCEKFFPDSKNEGPSFRMHAVIINKEGMQTQKYKSKNAQTPGNEEPISSGSAKSSAAHDHFDHEKIENSNDDGFELKKTPPKREEKSYILCHIRKIDNTYKAPKSSGKRRNSYDEEVEEEEEDEIDSEIENSMSSKKLVIEQKPPSLSKSDEDSTPLKELSISSSFKLNKSKDNKLRANDLGLNSSLPTAFQTINHTNNNVGFTLREKKIESAQKHPEPNKTIKAESTALLKKDLGFTNSASKQDSGIKNHPQESSKDLENMKETYKEKSENYDYMKLFNILVNFKENQ